MRFWWKLLILGGLTVGVSALADYIGQVLRERAEADRDPVRPWPGEGPSGEVVGWRPAVFFELSEPEQLWVLMELIRETGGCAEIEEEAARSNKVERLHELLVTLLGIKDPRMDLPRPEPAAEGRDAVRVERRAKHRVDDSLFKDNLLYLLRDRLPTDSPFLDGIVRAYDRDEEPYNRMRIVRAVGLIGGARAKVFLERVVREETRYRSLASREARKFLGAPQS